MNPERAFQMIQLLPLPLWACWLLFPRSALARHLATADWPWMVLGVTYAGCFVAAIGAGGKMGPDSFTSLGGMMGLFDSPWGALTAWVHYLCFDTFVGRWIVQRAPNAGYRLAPVLVATMMFGPLGLLLFNLTRPILRLGRDQTQRPKAGGS